MSSDKIQRACRLHRRALEGRAAGRLDQAEALGLRALAGLEQAVGPQHPDVANVLNHLAGIHVDRGDYAQAERLYRRSVRIMEKACRRWAANRNQDAERIGSADLQSAVSQICNLRAAWNAFALEQPDTLPITNRRYSRFKICATSRRRSIRQATGDIVLVRLWVQSWDGLGTLYRLQGRYAEAEPLFRQALKLAENAFGPDDLEVSSVLNNLAVLYKYNGQFAKAGRLYQRALAITEKALGPGHPEVATIYHNLGGLEHAAGNFARGEPFARRSVEIRQKAFGPDHPEVAADLAALAALLDGQKKYAEAERLYQRALAVFERVHGPEHYEIAVNLNNLAALYATTGRRTKAEPLYTRALAIKEKLLGTGHPDVAMTLNNLAVFYKSGGQYARAEPLYRRALAIFEQALGPKHPKVAICLENLTQLLRKMKRQAEARALEARAKAIRDGGETLSDGELAVTASINPLFTNYALAIRPSKIHRWGVVAEEGIPPRHKVIEYTGERISRREAKQRSARSTEYLFRINTYWWLDGAVGGSGAEYTNHCCEPNLYSCLVKGHILYMSKRTIEPGEELTLDSRFSPTSRIVRCRCGSPHCRGTINTK